MPVAPNVTEAARPFWIDVSDPANIKVEDFGQPVATGAETPMAIAPWNATNLWVVTAKRAGGLQPGATTSYLVQIDAATKRPAYTRFEYGVDPAHTIIDDQGKGLYSRQFFASATLVGSNKLAIFGGRYENATGPVLRTDPRNDVQIIDTARMPFKWDVVSSSTSAFGSGRPLPRSNTEMVALGDVLAIYGGAESTGDNVLYFFNTTSMAWVANYTQLDRAKLMAVAATATPSASVSPTASPSTAVSTNAASPINSDTKSNPAIYAVVAAVMALLALLIVLLWVCRWRRARKSDASNLENGVATTNSTADAPPAYEEAPIASSSALSEENSHTTPYAAAMPSPRDETQQLQPKPSDIQFNRRVARTLFKAETSDQVTCSPGDLLYLVRDGVPDKAGFVRVMNVTADRMGLIPADVLQSPK
ncbi:hypothetical protein HDU86_006484 [Geranomyces michiganensis]|nr:hypothetical protein HDU86_006484 [Geranomyces michiganensis]